MYQEIVAGLYLGGIKINAHCEYVAPQTRQDELPMNRMAHNNICYVPNATSHGLLPTCLTKRISKTANVTISNDSLNAAK